jgi:hypothetical protein
MTRFLVSLIGDGALVQTVILATDFEGACGMAVEITEKFSGWLAADMRVLSMKEVSAEFRVEEIIKKQ